MSNYEIETKIEKYIFLANHLFEEEKEFDICKILSNSKIKLDFLYENSFIYNFKLTFFISNNIFLEVFKKQQNFSEKIKEKIAELNNVDNEEIIEICFESKEDDFQENWRENSKYYRNFSQVISENSKKWKWGDKKYKVFVSHTSDFKNEAGLLKECLSHYDIDCFIADKNISATDDWQKEIEYALYTADYFVALLTKNFINKEWTGQEVGFAYGIRKPILGVNLGIKPYGFIGKYQGLKVKIEERWDDTLKTLKFDLLRIFLKEEKMMNFYINSITNSKSWDRSNILADLLPLIEKLNDKQLDKLVNAYNQNIDVSGAFGFNGTKVKFYGEGLVHYLNKITDRKFFYKYDGSKILED